VNYKGDAMRLLFATILPLLLLACSSPQTEFYRDNTGGKNLRDPQEFVQAEGIDVKYGDNAQEETIKYMESGLVMVGYSSFNAGSLASNADGALNQAKKIGASMCVVYKPKHTETLQGSVSTFIPVFRGGYAISAPIAMRQYDYLITFWMKDAKKDPLGIRFADLSSEDKEKMQSNRGVKILAILRGSPAYIADLLRNDFIKKFNNVEVEDSEHLTRLIQQNQRKDVVIVVRRSGESKTFLLALS